MKADKYAPVLERMIDFLGAGDRISFGEALRRASEMTGIPVPEEDQGPLLIVAFKIISSGKLPGAPDA